MGRIFALIYHWQKSRRENLREPTEKAKNQFLGSIEQMSPKLHPMSPIIFNSDSIYVGKWCAESVSKEYLPNSLKESFFFMLTYFPRSYMYHKKVRALYTLH